ncbi:hypothetical protein FIA58_006350 [Flavobacterium jejuense]|uniref:Uncharacterized protein n=1 Tax=Flavobacterium jejuense TaxID=1544455 RepID=A0ABX0IR88_9FLAO|nr:hypothetical protein [Flavobacterium jejuense]NHN25294.1 hypothetical protein [Flavobacterium jejuense]
MFNYDMNDSKNFEEIENKICNKDIKKIAKQIIKNGDNFEIIFKPEQ